MAVVSRRNRESSYPGLHVSRSVEGLLAGKTSKSQMHVQRLEYNIVLSRLMHIYIYIYILRASQ